MASEDLVTEQFQFLGIELSREVLRKCVQLCEEFGVDEESFTEQWMAFSLSHLNGAAPSIEHLELLARKEFSKRAAVRLNAPAKDALNSNTGSNLKLYGAASSVDQDIVIIIESLINRPDDDVLSKYVTSTNKKPKIENNAPPLHTEICPASYSPTIKSSAKYASRTNQGSVVHSFGDEKLLDVIKANGPNDMLDFNVSQVPNHDGELYTKSMIGFELLHEKASIFDSHIRFLSQCIMKNAGVTETTSVRHKVQTEVAVAGRIECDADARLNPKSVVLQGTWEESLSQAVPVDVDNLKQYSLFPGQVVVMRGVNPRGDRFVAREVLHDACLPVPDHVTQITNTLRGTLSILVVSGPYTTSDNLAYEPLKDLISYISVNKPHVVIMTGPFLDSDHAKVKDNSMAETYRSFFDKLIDNLGELSVSSPYTKIYIVSSFKDAFHVNIYPTPAYPSRRKHSNIHFVPDPTTLNISGFIIGVTSTDILMHLSQEEISMGSSGDKLSRLSSHLLHQQSYYPMWPPGGGVCADASLWAAHAQMAHTPHVLLLPSNFRYFVKEVNGCVVVNPEHVTKGSSGGTFAKLLISNDDKNNRSIAAQIVRI